MSDSTLRRIRRLPFGVTSSQRAFRADSRGNRTLDGRAPPVLGHSRAAGHRHASVVDFTDTNNKLEWRHLVVTRNRILGVAVVLGVALVAATVAVAATGAHKSSLRGCIETRSNFATQRDLKLRVGP